MSQVLIKYGLGMDYVWFRCGLGNYGLGMDQVWTRYGLGMDWEWTRRLPKIVIFPEESKILWKVCNYLAWTRHGPDMVITRYVKNIRTKN